MEPTLPPCCCGSCAAARALVADLLLLWPSSTLSTVAAPAPDPAPAPFPSPVPLPALSLSLSYISGCRSFCFNFFYSRTTAALKSRQQKLLANCGTSSKFLGSFGSELRPRYREYETIFLAYECTFVHIV